MSLKEKMSIVFESQDSRLVWRQRAPALNCGDPGVILAVWPWAGHLPSLNLSFLIGTIKILFTLQDCCEK